MAEIMDSPRAFYFQQPFPFEKWMLFDYHRYFNINDNSMLTLPIIAQNLEIGVYQTPGMFAQAVRSIFRNARLYHWNGAEQYRIQEKAIILMEEFDEQYFDILQDEEVNQKLRSDMMLKMQSKKKKSNVLSPIASETTNLTLIMSDESMSETVDVNDDHSPAYPLSSITFVSHLSVNSTSRSYVHFDVEIDDDGDADDDQTESEEDYENSYDKNDSLLFSAFNVNDINCSFPEIKEVNDDESLHHLLNNEVNKDNCTEINDMVKKLQQLKDHTDKQTMYDIE